MNIFLLKNYNNYYNRIMKRYNSLGDYLQNHSYIVKSNNNFNPNDNVATELVVNWNQDWMADYVIVQNPTTNEITRWFVIDAVRLRGEQYKLSLKHDVIADNFDEIMEADCFIEKGNIPDDNPLIYTSEDITVNQIKQDELQLRDETQCAWIVGYYGSEFKDSNAPEGISLTATIEDVEREYYIIDSSYNDWRYKDKNINYLSDKGVVLLFGRDNRTWVNGSSAKYYNIQVNPDTGHIEKSSIYNMSDGESVGAEANNNNAAFPGYADINNIDDTQSILLQQICSTVIDSIDYDAETDVFITYNTYLDLIKYNNKIVKFISSDGTAEFRLLSFSVESDYLNKDTANAATRSGVTVLGNPNFGQKIIELDSHLPYYTTTNATGGINKTFYESKVVYKQFRITSTPIYFGQFKADIPLSARKLEDSPYKMFAIPYSPDKEIIINNISIDSKTGFSISQEFARKYSGAGEIYDLQLLPYCPIRELIQSDGTLGFENLTVSLDYSAIRNGDNEEVSYIFFPKTSSFTLNIELENPIIPKNVKIESITEMHRLVSPNFNGQFQFNAAKNDGINYFNVDCTYKPYNPYIHLNPDFGGLYGKDFNDARGLICAGDFSLPMATNAWETYQIQNKNYQNTFDRSIENLEIQNKAARTKEITSGITNIAQAPLSGIGMAAAGNVPMGIATAVVNTAATAVNFGVNLAQNEMLRNEAVDYRKDMFGFQLGNIQALPQSVSKTTAFTFNNKIFPILETYSCTDVEKFALANKVANNGMTVGVIGKLKDYANLEWSYTLNGITINSRRYIKGSLIKLEGFDDDFHILNTISEEIFKGVYLE